MNKNDLMLSLILSVCLFLASCQEKQDATTPTAPVIPVIVTTPIVKDITVYLESIGTLHPSALMEIRPQTSGPLIEVLVKEGQWVRPGTSLFKIDPKPYEIKLQEAEAQLAIHQVTFHALEKKLNRYRSLVEKNLIAQMEWDDLEAETESVKASMDLDRARLNSAKLELDYCTVKSLMEGRVGKLDAHPGLLVFSGQSTPLATISKMDPLTVEFSVTEKEFYKIPRGTLQIEMKPLCSPDQSKKGFVTFLDNHFDSQTGLILLRGKIPNTDHSLWPGQAIRVRIPLSVSYGAQLIPQKTIRYNQKGPFVYIVNEDMSVAVRQLTLGKEEGPDQIVLEGLEPSEQIILDGHLRLSPGIKVEIKS